MAPVVDHLSPSSVKTFISCPRKWAYRYVEKLKTPKTARQIKGTAVDRAASWNLEQKIETGRDEDAEHMAEVAEHVFRSEIDGQGGRDECNWKDESLPTGLDSTVKLTVLHREKHAPLIDPADVQLELHRKLPNGWDFEGHLDFVDTRGVVGDFKTAKRRWRQGRADKDLQATGYGYLLDRPIDFGFWTLIDTGKSRYEEVLTTQRTTAQQDWLETAALDIADSIEAGSFPPNPDSYLCSEKWCDYWSRCMGSNKPPKRKDAT